MTLLPQTLSRYLAKNYALNFLILMGALLGIVYLFDTVELMRRAAKFEDVSLGLILQMGLLKLPEVGQIVLPFAILFSAMFTFWQLARRYELVVIRSAGLSVWQFLAPIVCVAMLIGVLQIVLINPLGALLVSKFESLESVYLERRQNVVSLSKQGLWLRQDYEERRAILHASKINVPDWVLKDVMVLFYDQNKNFERRIDSKSATLNGGEWTFKEATINGVNTLPEEADFITLATDLTVRDIEESFASPETISFWKLPSFIRTLESTGIDATSVRIHFYSVLAQPLLLVSMILLAASVSLRPPRERGTFLLVVFGIVTGFVIFFMSSFLQALGASHQIPIFLAAWSAPLICFLSGLALMMTLEDG